MAKKPVILEDQKLCLGTDAQFELRNNLAIEANFYMWKSKFADLKAFSR